MSGPRLSTLYARFIYLPPTLRIGCHGHPYFMEEKPESQRVLVTRLRSHSWLQAEHRSEPLSGWRPSSSSESLCYTEELDGRGWVSHFSRSDFGKG